MLIRKKKTKDLQKIQVNLKKEKNPKTKHELILKANKISIKKQVPAVLGINSLIR